MNFLEEEAGRPLDCLADFVASFGTDSGHLNDEAILTKRLHEVVAQAAFGESFGKSCFGIFNRTLVDGQGVPFFIFSWLDFDDEGRSANKIDSSFEFFLHRKNSHQAEGDDDSDGDCANVTLATINLGSDIPENECDDSDTSADDDERVVL